MREYDKLEEEEGKRARVVIKWIGKVWVAWEREGERVSEWALGPWLALFFFLSLSLTITLQLNACVCTCRHSHVCKHMCVCVHNADSLAHVPHRWVSPQQRNTVRERWRERTCRRERVPPCWAHHRNYRIAHTPLSSTTAPAAATAGGAREDRAA